MTDSPDIETAKEFLENYISENYISKKEYFNEKNNLETSLSSLENQNKNLIFKNFLDKNGCLDSDFIIYKESSDIENFLNLNDDQKVKYINTIKRKHPFVFKNNFISGSNPPESFNESDYVTRDDFNKMSYKEKADLFNKNRKLYESFI